MRIGDLDLAEKSIEENLNIAPCDRFAAMDEVRDTPTIDHETLPIVRELREELQRVTVERDAAIEDIPKICKTCKFGKSPCDLCVFDPDGELNWEWRGLVAENAATESEVQTNG